MYQEIIMKWFIHNKYLLRMIKMQIFSKFLKAPLKDNYNENKVYLMIVKKLNKH